jgi:uncharacterized membrane protein YoaK (UPF0700 family)
MTGNTVLVGISVLAQERPQLLHRSIALASFLAGVTMAALLLSRRPEADESTELRRGLALEALLLAAFCIFWVLDATNAFRCAPALLVTGACALGVQSVAVRRLKISGVVTTFITGTMTTAVVEAVSGSGNDKEKSAGGPSLLATIFVTYIGAAATGGVLFHFAPTAACFPPAAAVAAAGVRVSRR